MKQLLIIALSSILFTSCATVIFTTKPDLGERHHGKIPAEWQGRWKGEDNMFFYISADSVQYGGGTFSYYTSDSLKGDFMFFKENYCFIVKKSESDTIRRFVTMARINEKNEIECFNMDYAYFLKRQLITSAFAKQYFYEADSLTTNGIKLAQRFVNITMPMNLITRNEENSNKMDYELVVKNKTYEKYMRNLTLDPQTTALYTSYKYDFAFFKQYASDVRPNLILRKDKTMRANGPSLLEKRYEHLFKKDAKHDLNRLLETEL